MFPARLLSHLDGQNPHYVSQADVVGALLSGTGTQGWGIQCEPGVHSRACIFNVRFLFLNFSK